MTQLPYHYQLFAPKIADDAFVLSSKEKKPSLLHEDRELKFQEIIARLDEINEVRIINEITLNA